MSDLVGVVDSPATGGNVAVKETSDVTQDTGVAIPENGKQAGDSQESSEGGSTSEQQVRQQRGPSKLDTIRELRGKLREQRSYWESEIGTLKNQLEELKNSFTSGRGDQKSRKTFWEAPEEVIDERFDTKLSAMEKRLLDRFEQRESLNQESTEWKSETSEAAKFIQNQRGITSEDEEDIAEIVRNTPAMQNMRPMDRAKYAYFLWKEERGITDRSAAKAKASTVIGAPPAVGGQKIWKESEIEAEMKKFPPNPADWSVEDDKRFKQLDNEIRRAYSEQRVTK